MSERKGFSQMSFQFPSIRELADEKKESIITASIVLYAVFYVAVSIGGMSFLVESAWAPYIQTSETEAPDGSAWIHDENLLWAYGGTEHRVLMDGGDPRTGPGAEYNQVFTTCGAESYVGPSQEDCDGEYSGDDVDGEVTIIGDGIQEWTVPAGGEYTIKAVGAGQTEDDRGSSSEGRGVVMEAAFQLEEGDTLRMIVGQEADVNGDSAGGSGGTFVVKESDTGDEMFDGMTVEPLIIAGGAGGWTGDAITSTSGSNTGSDGQGGSDDGTAAGGGGGFLTDGDDGSSGDGGEGFINGGTGAANEVEGGFGGGAGGRSSCCRNGGGGGYSGGYGDSSNSGGYGGASFISDKAIEGTVKTTDGSFEDYSSAHSGYDGAVESSGEWNQGHGYIELSGGGAMGDETDGPPGSLWVHEERLYYIDEDQHKRWIEGRGTVEGEATFTTCGSTGRSGPSQTDCDSEYSGTDLEGEVTVVGDGIQEWTAPEDGTYRFNAYGAAAPKGSRSGDGGQGARYEAEVSLEAGDELRILIGQMGTTSGNSDAPSGGGGTFVAKVDSSGDQMFDGENVVPLVVAGGGAGYAIGTNSDSPGYSHGRMEEDGGDGTCMNSCASSPGSGGTNGDGGGGTGNRGAGGGGWYTDGGDGSNSGSGGENFLDGGLGGDGHGYNDGGFGAGGATDQSTGWGATGGGGGYSGGGGTYADSDSDDAPGGGGGSYVNTAYGELVDDEYAANDGHGQVEISWEGVEEAEGSPGSAWIDPNEGHLHYIDEFGGERYMGDNVVE